MNRQTFYAIYKPNTYGKLANVEGQSATTYGSDKRLHNMRRPSNSNSVSRAAHEARKGTKSDWKVIIEPRKPARPMMMMMISFTKHDAQEYSTSIEIYIFKDSSILQQINICVGCFATQKTF